MIQTPTPCAVDVRGVSFRYPDGSAALHDISLSITPHEKIALVGANGSGKSTLLLHLNGILRATSGTIHVCGLPLNDKTVSQIRARVGLLFQNPDDQLFSTRVYEDVAFTARHMGLPESEVRARVAHALALVGMDSYAERMPYHLSIGEKKRIALATLLTHEIAVLALDEPSAGLDPRARRSLITLLQSFTQQTVILSTHDMRLAAALCTRAIVLDSGRIVADGPANRVLYDRDFMEAHGLETPDAL